MWDRRRGSHPASWKVVAAIVAGAAVLLWPLAINSYPIVFSDTDAFLVQGGEWFGVWDKPFVYGPFLAAAHLHVSLAVPAAIQALVVSHVLWLTAWAMRRARPLRHVALCGALAAGSAAPWFVSLLMPDIWAPVAVLCLALLGFGRFGMGMRLWLVVLGGFAIAVHLAHLPMAAAVLAVVATLRWRRLGWVAAPLALALVTLLATNAAVFGRVSVSPHGAVFALARLNGDGLVAPTLAAECPASGWRLCAWQGRLPSDSDHFLWDSDGPVWSDDGGPIALAPEAAAIVRATLRRDPIGALHAAAWNTWMQLHLVALGDVLTAKAAGPRIGETIARRVNPADAARFRASRQARDQLLPVAERLNTAHAAILVIGAVATVIALLAGAGTTRGLAACLLAAVLANAAATGALSGPHDRYQARIAWVLLIPLLALTPPVSPPPRATSAPGSRRRRPGFR